MLIVRLFRPHAYESIVLLPKTRKKDEKHLQTASRFGGEGFAAKYPKRKQFLVNVRLIVRLDIDEKTSELIRIENFKTKTQKKIIENCVLQFNLVVDLFDRRP